MNHRCEFGRPFVYRVRWISCVCGWSSSGLQLDHSTRACTAVRQMWCTICYGKVSNCDFPAWHYLLYKTESTFCSTAKIKHTPQKIAQVYTTCKVLPRRTYTDCTWQFPYCDKGHGDIECDRCCQGHKGATRSNVHGHHHQHLDDHPTVMLAA